jgi:hypothetical protein
MAARAPCQWKTPNASAYSASTERHALALASALRCQVRGEMVIRCDKLLFSTNPSATFKLRSACVGMVRKQPRTVHRLGKAISVPK